MSYKVFTRNWYRMERGSVVANPGARKYTLDIVATETEARDLCGSWNATHKPGKLSRKAEYMRT